MRLRIAWLLLLVWPAALAAQQQEVDQRIKLLAARAARGDKAAREKALEELGRLRDPRVGPVLRERFLAEEDKGLREMAGFLLAEQHTLEYYRALRKVVGSSQAGYLPMLINHAMLEDARYLRALDLWAASRLDAKRTLEWLLANLKSKDRNVLLRALELLGLLADDAAAKPIIQLLWHRQPYVRIEAIGALARLTTASCEKELASVALRDPASHVRRHAVWAIYERSGVVGLRRQFTAQSQAQDLTLRQRAIEALDLRRIRSRSEEGPDPRFRYRGGPSNVLALFRRAELKRYVTIDVPDADVRVKLLKTMAQLEKRAPKYAFYVRTTLRRITSKQAHATGTFVTTRVFNIKPKTVRAWSYHHLAKTLVHDATHAYLYTMGEKSGEHRGEEESFQEAFWVDRYLTGSTTQYYDQEVDRYLKLGHWTRERRY